MPLGGLVSLAVLLPNILWMFFPPTSLPAAQVRPKSPTTGLLEIMEGIGRLGVFALPLFYSIAIQGTFGLLCLIVMIIALGFYYAGWVRYFRRGRTYASLYMPLLGVPIPMALSPVIYFLAASVVLQAGLLLIAASVLGIGHLALSWREYQRLTRDSTGQSPIQPRRKMKLTFRARLRRVGLILIGLLALAIISAWGYDVYASRQALIDYPAPGQFVSVNGAKMHYLCQGSGEPTLVLEAGFDGGALDWNLGMPALAIHHRVCAFDRLGQDWSEPAPHPRSFGTAADELHSALQTLSIDRPVVVGHSLGGALVQIYAGKYPVTGVVLVEGLSRDVAAQVVQRLGSYQALNLLGQLGLLRPLGSIGAQPAYPAELRRAMIALRSRSSALLNLTDEGAAAAQSAVAELAAAEARLDQPLLIIAAERSDVSDLAPGAFTTALKALARRKPQAVYVSIPEAGHYVQADHPQAVSEAIETWLAKIK